MRLTFCHQVKRTDGSTIHWAAGYSCVKCDLNAPIQNGSTEKEAAQKAREAALHRYAPLQKPLTLDELRAFEPPFPIWIERRNREINDGKCWPDIVLGMKEENKRIQLVMTAAFIPVYDITYRFWLNKPTTTERDAAKWEEAGTE